MSEQTTTTTDDDIAFTLRLLAHPLTGAAGISDAERQTLIDAAQRIEAQAARLRELAVERDYWQRLAANV